MKKETISVVIPAYNCEDYIAACISSLETQTRKPDEIVLVDDGSVDQTSKVARKFKCKIIKLEKNLGRGAVRDIGWRKTTGDIVVFLDADSIADKDWLSEIEKNMKHFDAVSDVRRVFHPDSLYLRALNSNYVLIYGNNYLPTCAWAFRKKVLEKIGGFNCHINVAEEKDISHKLKVHNINIGFVPSAIQYHAGKPRNLMEGLIRSFRHEAGKHKYYVCHPKDLHWKKHFTVNLIIFSTFISGIVGGYTTGVKFFLFLNLLFYIVILLRHGIKRRGFSLIPWHLVTILAFVRLLENYAETSGFLYGRLVSCWEKN